MTKTKFVKAKFYVFKKTWKKTSTKTKQFSTKYPISGNHEKQDFPNLGY